MPRTQPAPLSATTTALPVPVPLPQDRLLFDGREPLQALTAATISNITVGGRAALSGYWSFTENMDGAGTNAMRLDWRARFTSCSYATQTMSLALPSPYARRMFVQWKQHLGRTTTGGGLGTVGSFVIDGSCTGVARTQLSLLRAVSVTDAERVDYDWVGSPLAARVTRRGSPALEVSAPLGGDNSPNVVDGRTVTHTVYVQAESAPGAADGVLRVWTNDMLVLEQTGAAVGASAFARFVIGGRMLLPLLGQSEYFWDMVAWEPAAISGPVPAPAPDSNAVASVAVTPVSATISVGGSARLTAVALGAAGDTLQGRAISWSSSQPAIAAVDSTGLVRGLAAGAAVITATSEGKSAMASVTVNALPIGRVEVSPASASVSVSQTVQLAATVRDSAGNTVTDRPVSWSSLESATASVNGSGLVTGVAAGTARIVAAREGVADTASVAVTVAAPTPVASIVVAPASVSLQVAQTSQLSATLRDAAGNVLTGRTVNWQSLNTSIGTVTATGLVTALAAGTVLIRASAESASDTAVVAVTAPAPPPPANGVADPTLLPRATGQRPVAGTYGRSLRAGQTYVDPNSGATVLKLTDNATPVANSGMYHGYSEGGPSISQPWTGSDGQVYYTAKIGRWLVDIRYGTLTPTNWRQVPSDSEIGWAFSLNPATPRIAYTVTNWGAKRVERFNTATNQIENTGPFPWVTSASGQYLTWLQTQVNDTWIAGMLNSTNTVVALRTTDGLQRIITESGAGVSIDEPHLDRRDPVIYLSTNAPSTRNRIVNLGSMTYTNPIDPNGVIGDDHESPMLGKVVVLTWTANGLISVTPQGTVSVEVSPSPTDWAGDYHQAAQWVFNNPNEYLVMDQWKGTGNYPIMLGMIGFVSLNGDMRLIAASDAVGTAYGQGGQPHPTLAPDGKFVMWTSNMNNSGRYDVFIARIPVR